MNGVLASLAELGKIDEEAGRGCDVVICPPATLIHAASDLLRGGRIEIGAQDCHADSMGAHTGDIAAAQLKDAGATWVILGHSERRRDHGETDAGIRAKVSQAQAAGLKIILCLGEDESERDKGETLNVVGRQLAGSLPRDAALERMAIAYEPVWAIGSGRTPSAGQIAEVHRFLRSEIGEGPRLLYGGSMKADNAAEILRIPAVDGGLIGGASLKAAEFLKIIRACP